MLRILAYFVCTGLFGSLSVFEVSGQNPDGSPIYQNKSVTIFKGSKLMIKNTMTLNKERCPYHEEEVYVSKKKTNMYRRLASCPKSKDWVKDSIIGVINSDTRKDLNLENASIALKCSVNHTSSSHHQFDLHAELEVATDNTTTWQLPFDHVDFIVICVSNDSQKIRNVAAYDIVYDTRGTGNTSSIDDQQASSTAIPVNLTSSVNSTAKVENLPGKKKETDRLLAWYLVMPLAIIFSVLFWLVMITVSRLSKSRIQASEEV